MGRGRQKAKHTKVARELKYFSPNTDYSALERELTSSEREELNNSQSDQYEDESSKWAEYADDESYVPGDGTTQR